jgi:hypothetical protein
MTYLNAISKKFILLLLLISGSQQLKVPSGFASCGAASCPLDTVSYQRREVGDVHLDYTYEYIDQSEARIGTDKAAVGQIRGHHDEIYTLSKIQTFRVGAALASRFSMDVAVPFIHREHQHIHHHKGQDLLESWNIDGIGDLTVLTRTIILKPSSQNLPQLSVIFGGKLPTGKSDGRGIVQEDTGSLNTERAEVGIQPGSGAYDLITGASSVQFLSVPMLRDGYGQMPLFTEVLGRFTGKGRDDYRLGNSLTANAGLIYPLTRKLAVSGQINLRYARKDEKGTTSEEIDKTGGVWLYGTPGLQLNFTDYVSGYVNLQLPVYQNVNVIQLVSAYNLVMGASYKFNIF